MNINALVTEHLDAARADKHGRSAALVMKSGPLRQSLLALREGAELGAHEAPHAASIVVLTGSIVFSASTDTALSEGDIFQIPQERHSVRATSDAVFLLTAVNV